MITNASKLSDHVVDGKFVFDSIKPETAEDTDEVVETATEEKKINNSATNDNIHIYIILSTISLLGSTVTFKSLRKTN